MTSGYVFLRLMVGHWGSTTTKLIVCILKITLVSFIIESYFYLFGFLRVFYCGLRWFGQNILPIVPIITKPYPLNRYLDRNFLNPYPSDKDDVIKQIESLNNKPFEVLHNVLGNASIIRITCIVSYLSDLSKIICGIFHF